MKYIFVAFLAWISLYSSCFALTQSQKNILLEAHNSIRLEYGLPALVWDTKLEKKAQEWANNLAKNNIFVHSSDAWRNGMGENLYMSSGQKIISNGTDAVYAWLDEGSNYDYSSNSCISGSSCGHFTQVIWKNTKRVGCAQSTRKKGTTTSVYWVCQYDPAGNRVGEKPF